MNDLAPVIVRIILRYTSGILVSFGGMWAALGNGLLVSPEVEGILASAVGAVLAAVTEWLYAKARISGGPT